MSEIPTKFVCIRGKRYSCRGRYVLARGLDPLARFFHETVLPAERRLKYLIGEFGLPRRVVENILADLLKRNYALLDLKNGEIRPLQISDGGETRRYSTHGSFEIWEDQLTRTFLPARMIENLGTCPPEVQVVSVKCDESTRGVEFMTASNLRIMMDLRDSDPLFVRDREHDQPGWQLDGFEDRQQVRQFDIYLRICESLVDGEPIQFVSAPNLPEWLNRAWSLALRDRPKSIENEIVLSRAYLASVSSARGVRLLSPEEAPEYSGVLERCQLGFKLDDWCRRLAVAIRMDPPRERGLQTSRDLLSEIVDRVRGAGKVTLERPATNQCHFDELFVAAKRYVLIVVRDPGSEFLARVRSAALIRGAEAPEIFWVHFCTDPIAHDKEDTLLLVRSLKPLGPEMIIIDGVQARIGSLDSLFSSDPLIRVEGRGLVSQYLDTIGQELPEEVGWYVREESRARVVARGDESRGIEGDVNQALIQMSEVRTSIEKAIADVQRRTPTVKVSRAGHPTVAQSDPSQQATGRGRPEIERSLLKKAEDAADALKTAFNGSGLRILEMVPREGLIEVLTSALEALARRDIQRNLDLFVTDVPANLARGPLVQVLDQALKRAGAIHVTVTPSKPGLPPSDEAISTLKSVAARLSNPGFHLHKCIVSLPSTMVFGDDVIVIGGGSWFGADDLVDLAFAVEAADLAVGLRDLREGV